MNENTLHAYLGIFDLVPETCKVDLVRKVSEDTNESDDKVYKVIAVVVSPTDLPDVKSDKNLCTKIRNFATRKLEDVAGPDITHTVTTKAKKKEIRFDFSVHLIPENILEFEIENGLYRIRANGFGVFY